MAKQKLIQVTQPQDFFRELVVTAMGNQQIEARPETEFYLVNLLNQFMTTDRLYTQNAQGQLQEEPLVLLVKEALEQPGLEAQRTLFRRVGDVSLYMAGYFQDSLNRKLVDVDYYIDMGGVAYHQVAERLDEPKHRTMYDELASKFGRFVDVLVEVSEKTSPKTEKDLLRLYDLWVRTKSDRAAKALQEAGILPVDAMKDSNKKDWQ